MPRAPGCGNPTEASWINGERPRCRRRFDSGRTSISRASRWSECAGSKQWRSVAGSPSGSRPKGLSMPRTKSDSHGRTSGEEQREEDRRAVRSQEFARPQRASAGILTLTPFNREPHLKRGLFRGVTVWMKTAASTIRRGCYGPHQSVAPRLAGARAAARTWRETYGNGASMRLH